MLAAAIALLMASLAVLSCAANILPPPPASGGFRDFSALDLQGRPTHTAGLRAGKPLLLLFADTDCPVATEEVGIVDRLANDIGKKRLSAVSVFVQKEVADVKAAAAGKNYVALMDSAGAMAKQFGFAIVPVVMIVDAEGVLAYRNAGLVPYADLKKEVEKVVGSTAPG